MGYISIWWCCISCHILSILVNYSASFATTSGYFNYSFSERCLPLADSPQWERRYDVKNHPEPIIIEVSERVSHRLVSHILAILLRERLNYSVQFGNFPWDSSIDMLRRLSCGHEDCPNVRRATVNLEVWMESGFDANNRTPEGTVIDCGPLGPTARQGLFVHNKFVQDALVNRHISVDHWRTLDDINVRRLFQYPSWLRNIIGTSANILTNKGCNISKRDDCIPVLLDQSLITQDLDLLSIYLYNTTIFTYFIMDTATLTKYVKEMDELHVNNTNIYVANWFPNTLTVNDSLHRLSLPDCYDGEDQSRMVSRKSQIGNANPSCKFEINQLTKVVSTRLQMNAKQAFQLVDQLRFSQKDYQTMLAKVPLPYDTVNGDKILRKIACDWLVDNRPLWTKWTEEYNKKEILTIGGLFALHGKWTLPGLQKVAQSAIDLLNLREYKDSPYFLKLEVRNSTCEEEVVLQDYLSLTPSCQMSSQPVGIIAAVCSDAVGPMVKLSKNQRRLVVSPTAESNKFMDAQVYQYFFRTVPPMAPYKQLLLLVFHRYHWRQVVLMHKDQHFIEQKFFKEREIDVIDDFENNERTLTYAALHKTLSTNKEKGAKIFVVEYFQEGTCKILCVAYMLKMTMDEGYVWFVNSWLGDKWWNLCGSIFNDTGTASYFNCQAKDMQRMVRGSFIFKHEREPYNNSDMEKKEDGKERNTFYDSYTFDAVRVIGLAIRQLLQKKPSALSDFLNTSVTTELLNIVKNISLTADNKPIFNHENTRNAVKWVLEQLQVNKSDDPEQLQFKPLIQWESASDKPNSLAELYLYHKPQWKNGNIDSPIPGDGHQTLPDELCHVEGFRKLLGVNCSTAIYLINLIILLIFMTIMVMIIIYCRQKVTKTRELCEKKPLLCLCQELADLNIQMDHIIINRDLGKGAFGKVFGGETRVNDQWMSVAVKQVDQNASCEAKINFLTEAKMMRNLRHKNVVRLIAVCLTPSEDNYCLVMEFMLYGDLRNFLLSRRAEALDPNAFEVHPPVLTRFALEIASGLGYLHEQGIVHRDVACRNCLVGPDKVIKLGDLGLARYMKQTKVDAYYRLNKSNELPVRWLSPEVLSMGYFGVHSDVWAYGIVLYEIITFGVNPYQQYMEFQVVDMLTRGNFCITSFLPPSAAGTPIWELISKCCANDVAYRMKSTKEIITFLEENEGCVQPYLTEEPPKLVQSHQGGNLPVGHAPLNTPNAGLLHNLTSARGSISQTTKCVRGIGPNSSGDWVLSTTFDEQPSKSFSDPEDGLLIDPCSTVRSLAAFNNSSSHTPPDHKSINIKRLSTPSSAKVAQSALNRRSEVPSLGLTRQSVFHGSSDFLKPHGRSPNDTHRDQSAPTRILSNIFRSSDASPTLNQRNHVFFALLNPPPRDSSPPPSSASSQSSIDETRNLKSENELQPKFNMAASVDSKSDTNALEVVYRSQPQRHRFRIHGYENWKPSDSEQHRHLLKEQRPATVSISSRDKSSCL